jgi:hypothetical protein
MKTSGDYTREVIKGVSGLPIIIHRKRTASPVNLQSKPTEKLISIASVMAEIANRIRNEERE